MSVDLVIFDCDGVLVDSEVLASEVLAGLLTEHGVPTTPAESRRRYTGMSIKGVHALIEAEAGPCLPPDFVDIVHLRANDLFDSSLQPVAGVDALLAALPLPKCVASSGRPDRIRRSLATTGLLRHFDDAALFSAQSVARGKPAPDLFLMAAQTMRTDPARSLVLEDSRLGVLAGAAARMRVFGFTGASHNEDGHAAVLRAAGAERVFTDMLSLQEWFGQERFGQDGIL